MGWELKLCDFGESQTLWPGQVGGCAERSVGFAPFVLLSCCMPLYFISRLPVPASPGHGYALELHAFFTTLARVQALYGKRGTPAWMAPEVWMSAGEESPYTLAVDVFSFGVVLWELLTLQRPYHGQTVR